MYNGKVLDYQTELHNMILESSHLMHERKKCWNVRLYSSHLFRSPLEWDQHWAMTFYIITSTLISWFVLITQESYLRIHIYIYIYSFPEWSININTEFELHVLHIERIFSSPALNFHLPDRCVFAIKSAPALSTII